MKFILVAALPFLMIPLVFVLLNYACFWYAAGKGPHRAYLSELSKGKIHRLLFRGMLLSYATILFVIFLFPLGFWRKLRQPETESSCPLPPVILVHGLWHNPSAWILFRLWLKRAGFTNTYALGYSSWNRSFHEILGELDHLVDEVAGRFPGKPVILIGHSLGGLLCRAYSDRAENERKVGAVVTLGAPHQGSMLAAMAMGGLGRSLAYRGTLIEELEKAMPSSKIPRLAIFSPLDTMVLPYTALKVDHPSWQHYESSPVSHLGMVFHPATVKYVIRYLHEICSKFEARSS